MELFLLETIKFIHLKKIVKRRLVRCYHNTGIETRLNRNVSRLEAWREDGVTAEAYLCFKEFFSLL